MAKVEVKMPVDPFQVIAKALKRARKHPHLGRVVSVDYDEATDVLHARFVHGKIVDSEPLDAVGMVLASLDSKQRMIDLIVVHASEFASSSN